MGDFVSPTEGDLIDGRYRLGDLIDSGGFATVWEADDRKSGRRVAVKLGNAATHDRDEVIARFKQALQALNRIEKEGGHPNIVSFIDGNVEQVPPFIVTELLQKESLDDLVDRENTGEDLVATAGKNICEAVRYLHRYGIAHLDIKPDNILLRDGTTPVLIDFNTAICNGFTDPTLFCDDRYKPPEQTPGNGSKIGAGPAADVFACGLVLLYLLTGHKFESHEFEDEGIDAREYRRSCPDALAGTLRRATDGNPANRYSNAQELCTSLSTGGSRHSRATLVATDTGQKFSLSDGDTFGREVEDSKTPSIVIRDEEQYISPIHAEFRTHGGGWFLRDRSLNGTYVRKSNGWVELLSFQGAKRQSGRNGLFDIHEVQQITSLSDGDLIVPVDRGYGVTFRFRI